MLRPPPVRTRLLTNLNSSRIAVLGYDKIRSPVTRKVEEFLCSECHNSRLVSVRFSYKVVGMKRKKAKGLGRIGLTVFSLPFAGVGVFMAVLLVRSLLAQDEMKSWAKVPATVLESELETHRGDDSTTYEVTARYRYSFERQEYTGTRVGLSTGADNFGSYQQDWAAKLKQHQSSGEPLPAYVDPNNPVDAILDRKLRISMLLFHGLFALVFGGVGFGLLFGSWLGGKKVKQATALEAQYPDEPWNWRADWASGKLESDTRAGLWVSIGFATFWNLVSSPVLFVLNDELAKGNYMILIALVFPLVGLGLIIWALRSILVYRRYGRTVLHLAEVPGVIGGRLTGAIKLTTRLEPEDGFALTFSCVRITVTGSGKHQSTQRNILWQQQSNVQSGNPGDPFNTIFLSSLKFRTRTPTAIRGTQETKLFGSSKSKPMSPEWTTTQNLKFLFSELRKAILISIRRTKPVDFHPRMHWPARSKMRTSTSHALGERIWNFTFPQHETKGRLRG